MAWGTRPPAQEKAILANYADKEKLLKTGTTPPIKPPRISATLPGQKSIGSVPKPKLATVPEAPAFGRKRFYGEKWS